MGKEYHQHHDHVVEERNVDKLQKEEEAVDDELQKEEEAVNDELQKEEEAVDDEPDDIKNCTKRGRRWWPTTTTCKRRRRPLTIKTVPKGGTPPSIKFR